MKVFDKTGKAIELAEKYKTLTVNSDFKINQRGQSEYTTNTVAIHTVDMWKINSGTIYVLDKGIRYTGKNYYLSQFIDGNYENKTLIMVVKTSLGRYVMTGVAIANEYLQQSNSELKMSFAYIKQDNRIDLSIQNLSGDITIEYIDLFEGEVDYTHVAEDELTALLRCMERIQKVYIPNEAPFYSKQYFSGVIFFIPMKEIPIVVRKNMYSGSVNVSDKVANIVCNRLAIAEIQTSQSYDTLKGEILLSCEP